MLDVRRSYGKLVVEALVEHLGGKDKAEARFLKSRELPEIQL